VQGVYQELPVFFKSAYQIGIDVHLVLGNDAFFYQFDDAESRTGLCGACGGKMGLC
jgi:hypothetical protein